VHKFILSVFAVASLASAGPISTLDFEGLGVSQSTAIPQTYGDRLANTPNVVVDYGTNSGVVAFYISGYSNLRNVAWGTGNPSVSTITFTADPGFNVSLLSLNIGYWSSINSNTGIFVSDGKGNKLWEYKTATPNPLPANAPLLSPNVTAEKLVLTWGNSWGIAVDNIQFSQDLLVNTVPEPSTLALVAIAGLAAAGARRFRH
jgi:hypothetical protein